MVLRYDGDVTKYEEKLKVLAKREKSKENELQQLSAERDLLARETSEVCDTNVFVFCSSLSARLVNSLLMRSSHL